MEIDKLQKKVIKGFVSLSFRKVVLDAINFITIFIILAKVLPIQIIGIYGVAQSIVSFFSYFSDVGLGAALIQKKQVTIHDLKTTFLIQETIIVILSIIIWFSADFVANFYQWDMQNMWLVRALGIGFLLTSLKVIPSTLLERELKFELMVFTEVIETLVFNGLLIYLTFEGFGVSAFSYAVIARSLIGALVLNILSPWRIGFEFNKQSAKELLHFGLPFQLNSILSLLKDRLTPLITARIVGDTGFGYLTWAQGISNRPLEIMSIIIRISFPAFSRLQDNYDELKKIVEKSLFITVLFVYPFLFGVLAILPRFIDFMGKDKFAPAMPLIYLFSLSVFWAVPSTIFTNVLNSIGKVNITLKLMVMWTVLTWALSPLLALYFGYLGVAIASAIISFSSIIPIVIVVKMLKVEIINNVIKPFIASLMMSILVFLLSTIFEVSIISLISLVVVGVISYGLIIWIIAKERVQESLRFIFR